MLESLFVVMVAAVLQVTVIRYYFAKKREHVQGLLNHLYEGEVS